MFHDLIVLIILMHTFSLLVNFLKKKKLQKHLNTFLFYLYEFIIIMQNTSVLILHSVCTMYLGKVKEIHPST